MRKHLLGPHPLVTIVGEGGVGKTALAVQCLYDILDLESPPYDAIIWVSLKTNILTVKGIEEIRGSLTDTLGAIQIIADYLGARTSENNDEASLIAELLEYMQQFKILLVIDNFETFTTNPLRPLLSSVPKGSKVLITSRVGLGELELRYKLDPLELKTSASLLRRFSKCLNVELLAGAPDSRLEKYCALLFMNPLLIKWFVQSVASGSDPESLSGRGSQAFEAALRYCFQNLFARLTSSEKEILHVLAAARRRLTFTELFFLLQEVSALNELAIEAALSTLHNSSMLKRTPPSPRSIEGSTEITLTDVAGEYIAKFAPPPSPLFQGVQKALVSIQRMTEQSAVQQAMFDYDIHAIRVNTKDQRICAVYLDKALKIARVGHFIAARAMVNIAKKLLPGYSEVYRISAVIETHAGDLFKATNEIELAVQHGAGGPIVHYQYALFLMEHLQDTGTALIQVDAALTLNPGNPTLETLKALILTRLGRYRDAAKLYESLLIGIDARPRKWRITTRDQAAECYRRWAEQDATMRDNSLFKTHIDRACSVIEQAFGKCDSDVRMKSLYSEIIESSLFVAIAERDEEYARFQLRRFGNAKDTDDLPGFKKLHKQGLLHAFGEEFALAIELGDESFQTEWAKPPASVTNPTDDPPKRLDGFVKALPITASYGFLKDIKEQDWFFHKSSLKNPADWPNLREGQRVIFIEAADERGRPKAMSVEIV